MLLNALESAQENQPKAFEREFNWAFIDIRALKSGYSRIHSTRRLFEAILPHGERAVEQANLCTKLLVESIEEQDQQFQAALLLLDMYVRNAKVVQEGQSIGHWQETIRQGKRIERIYDNDQLKKDFPKLFHQLYMLLGDAYKGISWISMSSKMYQTAAQFEPQELEVLQKQ